MSAAFTDKKAAPTAELWVEHGRPLLFAGGTKGIALDRDTLRLQAVDVAGGDRAKAGVVVHDQANASLAQMLVAMAPEHDLPVAPGEIYENPAATFESAVVE